MAFADPNTGEQLPAITLGAFLQSKTRRWNSDAEIAFQFPQAGHVVGGDFRDGQQWWRVAQCYRGQVAYHWLPDDDIDLDAYAESCGVVNPAPVRDLAKAMNREMNAPKGRRHDHLTELLVLSSVLDKWQTGGRNR